MLIHLAETDNNTHDSDTRHLDTQAVPRPRRHPHIIVHLAQLRIGDFARPVLFFDLGKSSVISSGPLLEIAG